MSARLTDVCGGVVDVSMGCQNVLRDVSNKKSLSNLLIQPPFSLDRLTGPIQSYSSDVRLSMCPFAPLDAIFSQGL